MGRSDPCCHSIKMSTVSPAASGPPPAGMSTRQLHPTRERSTPEEWPSGRETWPFPHFPRTDVYKRQEAFRARGAVVDDGAFGENLVVEGYDFKTLPIGTKFRCGDVELELTQVGKECHSHCEIYKVMGDCIMPREGVFTRVLHRCV